MAGGDEDNSPNDAHDDDELANKLARLTEEQHALYRNQVDNSLEQNGNVSRRYQHKLADSLLKDLPPSELSRELGELNRQEFQYTYWRDQPAAAKHTIQTAPPVQEPATPERAGAEQIPPPRPALNNPLEGKLPSGPPRDYSKLQLAHEEVAAQLKQANAQPSAEPATAMLSKDQLITMLEHFPEIRREANLPTTQSEIHERAALSHVQDADRIKLEQAHGAQPDLQQQHERNLLDHQHLAEQVGVQAKWIAQHLKAQDPAEAGKYNADSRRALRTSHNIYEQRQHPGAARNRTQETARGIEPDEHQKQADPQQRVQEGKELTSEQRANPSPEARQRIEREERTAAAREVGAKGKDQNAQQGNARTGKSPSGGRSR